MKKVTHTRTQYLNWFQLVRRDAISKQDRLMQAKRENRNQAEIDRLEKVIRDCEEEDRRYRLARRVFGDPLTALV
jgi:hypothetical protein